MTLKDHPLMWPLGVALVAAASVEFGVTDIQLLSENVSPYSTWIFIIALGGGYLLSQRDIGSLSDWELGSFVVGLGGFAAIQFIPQVADIVANNQPYSGIALTIVTMIAFYILTNENI